MRKLSRTWMAMAGVWLAASGAHAVGTDAGTDISNTASVDYTVGGVNQPDVTSNTVTFKADRRINLSVSEVGNSYTDVAPGQAAQVLTFTVTNTTNGSQDFRLIATQDGVGVADPFGGTDDFDTTGVSVFVDSNANGTYEAGVDVGTFLDEIPEDATRTVFIVSNIPAGRANGDTAGLTLTAVAADAGVADELGSDATQTAGPEDPDVVETVFGDGAGDTDAARDGRFSNDDAYRVQSATLVVTKTATVISDPFNGTSNPRRIPGAVIEYCITVRNTGSTAATAVVVTDVLTSQPVTYSAGTLFSEDTGGTCAGGDAEDDDASGADETNPNGGAHASGTVSFTFPNLPTSATKAGRFRVTIDN